MLEEDGGKVFGKQLHKNFHDFVLNHSGRKKLEECERMFVTGGKSINPGKLDLYLYMYLVEILCIYIYIFS